jgi:hypothetical protein
MSPGSLGFREESFQPCVWSLTPWGTHRTRLERSTCQLPSPRQDEVGRHTGMFSELNTQPGCTPVNASTRRLPDEPHHSGPRRLARSYLARLFHSLLSSGLRRRTLSPFRPPARGKIRDRVADRLADPAVASLGTARQSAADRRGCRSEIAGRSRASVGRRDRWFELDGRRPDRV